MDTKCNQYPAAPIMPHRHSDLRAMGAKALEDYKTDACLVRIISDHLAKIATLEEEQARLFNNEKSSTPQEPGDILIALSKIESDLGTIRSALLEFMPADWCPPRPPCDEVMLSQARKQMEAEWRAKAVDRQSCKMCGGSGFVKEWISDPFRGSWDYEGEISACRAEGVPLSATAIEELRNMRAFNVDNHLIVVACPNCSPEVRVHNCGQECGTGQEFLRATAPPQVRPVCKACDGSGYVQEWQGWAAKDQPGLEWGPAKRCPLCDMVRREEKLIADDTGDLVDGDELLS